METFMGKLKSREWQLTLATSVVFLLSLFGIGIEATEVDKIITGLISAVTIVAFIINRASVKNAETKAYVAAPIIISETEVEDFPLN